MSTTRKFKFENIHFIHNEHFHGIEIFNDSWNFKRTFNNTAFFIAVEKGHLEIVKSLLAHSGTGINYKDI